jgi:putative hydrolase of the HAD superfamily
VKLPASIRAVTFDIGGTLITPRPSVGEIYAEVAARHGWDRPDAGELERRFRAAWRAHPNFGHTREEWRTLVHATFAAPGGRAPTRALFRDLYARFTGRSAWHVFEDVVPALQALSRRGLKLGVISNWDRRLGPLLRTLGLWDYFDAVVVSCHLGTGKPARVMFDTAAARLRRAPAEILHIGDSPEMDVRGALRAGMRAALIRRGAGPARAGTLRTLAELI